MSAEGDVLTTAQTIGAVATDSIKSSMLEEDK